MMLGKKYISINSTLIPNPTSFKEDEETIENVFQSEAGTDIAAIVRSGKKKFSTTFQVSSFWMEKLRTYSRSTTASVSIDGGVAMTMRIRNFKATLLKNSENVANTDGLWTVSMEFIEV